MYTPSHNRAHHPEEILRFMRAHDFATLVTGSNHRLLATHLPFLIDDSGGSPVLHSHMASANEQWKHFGKEEVLVIFQGPHAYVSPTLYEKPLNVPTWNYVAVHVYGTVTVIEEQQPQLDLLHRMVKRYDPVYYEKRFQAMPGEFLRAKLKGIVAFRVAVSRMEERFKLSQDKTATEKENIVATLSSSGDAPSQGVAAEMQRLDAKFRPEQARPKGEEK